MIMNRSRCKNAYFKNKTVANWEKYGKLRKECIRVRKNVKREYFENLNINFVDENKTFWKTVRPYFSNKNLKNSKIVLVENNEIVTDNRKNAEIMNNYFVNITQNWNIPESILGKMPRNTDVECLDPIDQILLNYCKQPSILTIKVFVKPTETFSFNKADEKEIEKEILELSSKQSAGADAIPPKVIKDSVSVLKSPLTQLLNTSVGENHFPSDLKYANIAPLYKKDDNTDNTNYRPISILPSISKIFERLMFKEITTYVSNLFSPYLCGFRKGYNAQHVLLRLKHKRNKCLDKKECVGLFMMDLSKAFDCIPHELMIATLHAYGFEKNA